MKIKFRNLSSVEMGTKYLGVFFPILTLLFTVKRSFEYFTVAFIEKVVIRVKYDYPCY